MLPIYGLINLFSVRIKSVGFSQERHPCGPKCCQNFVYPMLCQKLVCLLKLFAQSDKMMSKDLWAKWNRHYNHVIAEFTGCTRKCHHKNALLFHGIYCHFQIWKWKLSSTLWFLGHTWHSVILECLVAKWLVHVLGSEWAAFKSWLESGCWVIGLTVSLSTRWISGCWQMLGVTLFIDYR